MKTVTTLFIGILMLSCHDDAPTELDRLSKMEWFQALQTPCRPDDICKTYISRAQYNGTTVYFSSIGGALCDPSFYVRLYNGEGEIVKEYRDINEAIQFQNEVTSIETIWKCNFFVK